MTIPQPPHAQSHTIVPLRELPAWKALDEHHTKIRNLHLRQLFAEDSQRGERFTLEALGLYFDYSKHRITGETIRLLLELAEQSGLRGHIDAIFAGDKQSTLDRYLVRAVDTEDVGQTRRALRTQRLYPGHDLADRFIRPVGRRAWQSPGRAHCSGTGRRGETATQARHFDQRTHPALPRRQAANAVNRTIKSSIDDNSEGAHAERATWFLSVR
jgi:hypothetical protein